MTDSSNFFMRHSGWVGPEDLTAPLHIIGCGAVGSWVAITAVRMGFTNFILYDDDTICDYNIANQAYCASDVGLAKVEALKLRLCEINNSVNVTVNNRRFVPDDGFMIEGLVVMGVDSMEARKMIFAAVQDSILLLGIFEARLAFEHAQVNIVIPGKVSDTENFLNGLVDDADLPESPCNKKICTTLVLLVSSYLVHQMCSLMASRRENSVFQYGNKCCFSTNFPFSTYLFRGSND